MSVPERYWCWTATGDGGLPMPVVSCFAGSAAALERLEVAAGPAAGSSRSPNCAPISRSSRPARCSRPATTTPASAPPTQIAPRPEVTAALIEPLGRLAFAGEQTAAADHALMEGAIRSGRRAARLLRSS
jgi:hypothetical protein